MANTLITPSNVARLAYAGLRERTLMAALVVRDFDQDFQGAQGDTITVRKPATFVADDWNAVDGITIQNATETSFTVTLNKILDVSFAVPAKERTLNLNDINEQLVVPAVDALVDGVEALLMALRNDVVQEVGDAGATSTYDHDDPRVLIDAGRVLNKKKVPRTGRYSVVGPETEASWVADPLFHEADKRGDTDGLREAELGRKFGFDNFGTTFVEPPEADPDAGEPTTEVGVAFHRSAFALVMRALALPEGAASAAVFGDRGLGIRVVRDYDIDKKQDVVSLDVLCGAKTLDANRAVLIKGADALA